MAWTVSPGLQLLFTVLVTLTLSSAEEMRVPPSIVSPVERQQLLYSENDWVEVKCSATGQPAPTYKWTWNGNDILNYYITFSATTGILTIDSLTTREEGLFVCYAKTTFSNGMTATAVSATVEIRVARVEDFVKRPVESYSGTEGNYVTIPCDKNLPKYYGAITFKWYTVLGSRNDEIFPDERKFIDQGGNLHFSYVLKSDEMAASTPYKCAIANKKANNIRLGNENSLTVTSTGPIPNSAPRLQYNTSGSFLTVEVGKNATLECVFSGYITSNIPSETVPRVTWYDQDGRVITQGGRYDITSNGRTLTIMNVTEDDEKTYLCRGTNSLGSDEGSLALNVTSLPIWVHRLESTTVVEWTDAVLSCVTRSAKGEQSPSQPKWSRNTDQMGSTYDPNKFQFNADKTTLTVKSVNKDTDISCYQCTVANSVGVVHDDGCVNVIKPIEIKVRPLAQQSVNKGDEVDLTVVASTDPLFAPEMTYSWIFKNVTYTDDRVPPHVSYDSVNNRAYINTSGLTDEEFKSIGGLYRRVISHPVETVYVDVSVEAEHVPVAPIEIRVRPAAQQTVKKGDVVDLTVVASTDPLYAPNMTDSWIFKNVNNTDDKAPPYVTYDLVTKRAYIYTSALSNEFKEMAGIYRRVISHPLESVSVDVNVD
ncbi:neurofascin-like [Pomacea canaliculata]|uniref:neurofascin-like n=1 Tax=Pomacea canaliculata TaxID=400727 RepID=UPI000D73A1A3|nr:neurofascin-like [Pomacea canaliculata]